MPRPDLAWLVSGLTADASKIVFDQPGAAYDRVHSALERAAPLPPTLRGRVLLVGTVLLAKQLFGGTSDNPGPLGRFIGEIADDAVTETLKRVIQHAGTVPVALPETPTITLCADKPTSISLARRIDALTNTIAPWMGQKEA